MFLGYADKYRPYQVWSLKKGKVLLRRKVPGRSSTPGQRCPPGTIPWRRDFVGNSGRDRWWRDGPERRRRTSEPEINPRSSGWSRWKSFESDQLEMRYADFLTRMLSKAKHSWGSSPWNRNTSEPPVESATHDSRGSSGTSRCLCARPAEFLYWLLPCYCLFFFTSNRRTSHICIFMIYDNMC